jgi:hypothetical protein
MKNLRLIAGLVITTAFFVGCAVSSEPGDKSIRIDNANVTQKGDVSTISNGQTTVTTSSLSLTTQSNADGSPDVPGICCTNCNIYTGNCDECHTCELEQ